MQYGLQTSLLSLVFQTIRHWFGCEFLSGFNCLHFVFLFCHEKTVSKLVSFVVSLGSRKGPHRIMNGYPRSNTMPVGHRGTLFRLTDFVSRNR